MIAFDLNRYCIAVPTIGTGRLFKARHPGDKYCSQKIRSSTILSWINFRICQIISLLCCHHTWKHPRYSSSIWVLRCSAHIFHRLSFTVLVRLSKGCTTFSSLHFKRSSWSLSGMELHLSLHACSTFPLSHSLALPFANLPARPTTFKVEHKK